MSYLGVLKAIQPVISTVIAAVAVYLTLRAENRNQARFLQQLELSRRIAEANIRPLLALTISAYVDRKAIELTNHGGGTAVIRSLEARRGHKSARSIIELVTLAREVVWDDFTQLGNATEYLQPKSSDVLLELTQDGLIGQGINKDEADELLEALEEELDEITIFATYEDVLGNVIATNAQIV